jgi:hypothetical protein
VQSGRERSATSMGKSHYQLLLLSLCIELAVHTSISGGEAQQHKQRVPLASHLHDQSNVLHAQV